MSGAICRVCVCVWEGEKREKREERGERKAFKF